MKELKKELARLRRLKARKLKKIKTLEFEKEEIFGKIKKVIAQIKAKKAVPEAQPEPTPMHQDVPEEKIIAEEPKQEG